MSGLEVAAAIFGIIRGVASAYKMAVELGKRHEKSKRGETAKAEREVSKNIEQLLKRIEKQLKVSEARLTSLTRTGSASANPAALYSDMAIQHVLTIMQRILAVATEDAVLSSETPYLRELEQHTDRWDREANLISKTVSPNAIRNRQNLCRFDDVAVQRVPGSEWAWQTAQPPVHFSTTVSSKSLVVPAIALVYCASQLRRYLDSIGRVFLL
jgi:hypothetical protein